MGKVFISYNKSDKQWAEWIAWTLEENGYTTIIQAWDFRPGSNFVLEMQKAAQDSDKTIAVLSPNYLNASFTQSEWAAAFANDPTGEKRKLVPVLVSQCNPEGILSPLVYINLLGLDETKAKETLIEGLKERAKPDTPPSFPGKPVEPETRTIRLKPSFPMDFISLSKLPVTGPDVFGREKELEILDKAWEDDHTHIVTLVAWGGVGKTSLINHWLNLMERKNYCGASKVYGWSFYSQGSAEGKQASADEFLHETLKWFGNPNPNEGDAVAKGRRLACLVKKEKCLIILDGLEPLQYPPGEVAGFEGQLKDSGLKMLLKELAAWSSGLCVITTRTKVSDLSNKVGYAVKQIFLGNLSNEAGVQLLKNLKVNSLDKEILEAVQEYRGHALALTLLGNYINAVYDGDIRKRDSIRALTDDEEEGGHAKRVMESYETWLAGLPELDILYMMGLFDRPAPERAIETLKKPPAIDGVTSQIQKLSYKKWQYSLKHLRELGLLSNEKQNGTGVKMLDCHPLIREYFGKKLKDQNPDGWKTAHERLYHYYKNLPTKKFPDTLEEMEPLFAAVAHGCAAGLHQEALYDVFWKRIRRENEAYSVHKLGAFSSDLAALSHFFETPWSLPASGLNDHDKASLLNWAAFDLRAVGRLREAIQHFQRGLEMCVKQEDWKNAATDAKALSELSLTIGQVSQAVDYTRQSMEYADKSGDGFTKEVTQTTLADALNQSGQLEEAGKLFMQAEAMRKKRQPKFHYLYSLNGFQYCDLLLSLGKFHEVKERAEKTLEWAIQQGNVLHIALDKLSLGKAWMAQAIETQKDDDFKKSEDFLDKAVEGLRKAGDQEFLVRGLLARAWYYRVIKKFDHAWDDLNEAKEIAEMGDMNLYLADYNLEAGRLCKAEGKTDDARKHFKTAKEMIDKMGYHRRDKEIE